jgi:hypothetical protein
MAVTWHLATCLPLLHLCTGRRPICTFALRTARGAVPTSTQGTKKAALADGLLFVDEPVGLFEVVDLDGIPVGLAVGGHSRPPSATKRFAASRQCVGST